MVHLDTDWSESSVRTLPTSYGPVGYRIAGHGRPAIFLHGLCLNSYFWRHQLKELSSARQCIAIDLLAHGQTPAPDLNDYSFIAQANMVLEAADRLGIPEFDLIGNDAGGAIAQVICAKAPERVRSLVLTNCDVHDNWPPKRMWLILSLARMNLLGLALRLFQSKPELYRGPVGYASKLYEDRKFASDELMARYIEPLIKTKARREAINRYCSLREEDILVKLKPSIEQFQGPSLIIWGDADLFFPVHWAYWLEDLLPNTAAVEIVRGGKIFFPEERPVVFNERVLDFWATK